MHKLKFNFTSSFRIIAIALILSFVFSQFFTKHTQAAIGINRQINFQGKLVNNPTATNVTDATYTVVFTFYDRDSGGTALWTESQTVTTKDGIFRVALGSVTPFPANFNFNWDGLYLGIKVNSDSEMTPRVRMAAVPFAFNAEKVAGLTVQDTSGNASTSGTLQVANGKTVSFADAFTTSGANPLTLTTSGTTNVTLPTTGTLLTNTASANQTITSSQTTGNVLSVADSTGLSGAITGLTIGLTSSTNSQNKTGISFDLSGGTGGTYYDLLGTGSTWSITRAGVLSVASCSGCGGATGVNWWNQLAGALSPVDINNDLLIGSTATSSALFSYTGIQSGNTIASVSGSLIMMPNNGWGNVGINTTTPREKLQVVGNFELGAAASGAKAYRFRTNGGSLDFDAAAADMYFSMFSSADFSGTQRFYMMLNYDTHLANLHGDWLFQTGNTGGGGNPVLAIDSASTGNIGINTDSPLVAFDVRGNSGTLAVASVSGRTSFAALNVNNDGVGDLIAASASGWTRFTVKNNGTVDTVGDASVASALTFKTNGGGQIQTSSNQGLTFGGNTTGNITIAPNNGTGILIVGSSTNGLTFDIANSGPTYTGSARPTKKITLSPEYPGAVLTASGSAATSGSMTSDASPSAALSNWRTYYEWSSSQTTLQDYTVVVRVKLPNDFSAWSLTNALTISYNTELPGNGSNKLDVVIYNADTSLTSTEQSTPVVIRTANISATAKTWLDLSIDDSDLNDNGNALDTAGDTAVIYLKMYSKDDNHVQIGDITLNYLSKF